ncbi:L,D-transpeptidase [Roseateles sp.]|uniref:L,D-transpeptidase n=1 Tax=Roseateles sp. TaxID=1971397 RepID=UPI00286A8754|nr:TonB-dependent receptor [Roseateles sp.]
MALATFTGAGCAIEPGSNSNSNATGSPSPSASPAPSTVSKATAIPVTLPVLDALFSDDAFKSTLKAKVVLTDDQITQLQKLAADEVARLRQLNTEERGVQESPQAEESRQRASEAIRALLGEQKAEGLFALAREHWVKGGDEVDTSKAKETTDTLLPEPNTVPKDTRVVVNIPAYRMDVFQDGSLVKSYKIGIGYPEFPLPTGLRKAQTIIFNPTWTPPDEPWVARMKGVAVGEKVAAGSKLNPLGPIKIPIGQPSLIHGGKSPAKLGTFASHGCVGLTTPQVQDFSKLLARVSGKAITYGLELEAKFRLDEFFPEAWPVQMRSNVSLFRSSVDSIPGPNNTLDQQPSATANLGADYRLRSLPLNFGASVNWTPSITVQQTLITESSSSRKLVADAFALWTVNQQYSLRLSASNFAPLDYSNASFTQTPLSQVTTSSSGASYTQWALRMEIKI